MCIPRSSSEPLPEAAPLSPAPAPFLSGDAALVGTSWRERIRPRRVAVVREILPDGRFLVFDGRKRTKVKRSTLMGHWTLIPAGGA